MATPLAYLTIYTYIGLTGLASAALVALAFRGRAKAAPRRTAQPVHALREAA
jgi:hypothetical protein